MTPSEDQILDHTGLVASIGELMRTAIDVGRHLEHVPDDVEEAAIYDALERRMLKLHRRLLDHAMAVALRDLGADASRSRRLIAECGHDHLAREVCSSECPGHIESVTVRRGCLVFKDGTDGAVGRWVLGHDGAWISLDSGVRQHEHEDGINIRWLS